MSSTSNAITVGRCISLTHVFRIETSTGKIMSPNLDFYTYDEAENFLRSTASLGYVHDDEEFRIVKYFFIKK